MSRKRKPPPPPVDPETEIELLGANTEADRLPQQHPPRMSIPIIKQPKQEAPVDKAIYDVVRDRLREERGQTRMVLVFGLGVAAVLAFGWWYWS